MKIVSIRHEWPEKTGFNLTRMNGADEYVFLHFIVPVELWAEGKKQMVAPDTCIVFSPHRANWFRCTEDLIHDWMHVDGDVAEVMAKYGLVPDKIYCPSDGQFITDIMRDLEAEFFANRLYVQDWVDAKINELFIHIARNISKDKTEPLSMANGDLYPQFRRLRAELFMHLEQDWQIASLASSVQLSKSRFHVIYKKIFGISPVQDIIMGRVEKAKRLLLSNQYTIEKIAVFCGYKDEYHFIRQFKKTTGVTPGSYRKSNNVKVHGLRKLDKNATSR